jgi:PAS domain S-box-containing protein
MHAQPNPIKTLYQLAFDHCPQASFISVNSSGKIVLANKAACKLFGYTRNGFLVQGRAAIFGMTESSLKKMMQQAAAKGKASFLLSGRKRNGKIFFCEMNAAVFADTDNVTKMVVSIMDLSQSISDQQVIDTKKERIVAKDIVLAQAVSDAKMAESNEWIRYMAQASYDVMWDWDITSGRIYVGDSVEEVFGYKIPNNEVHYKDFIQLLPAKSRAVFENKLAKALTSKKKRWSGHCSIRCMNGSSAATNCRASIIRNSTGKATRMIGSIQDVSKLQELEGRLDMEIRLKEQQIAYAMADAKDTERADIGKELHDNINQLLFASRMYLAMAKKGGANSMQYLGHSSRYTLTAIEEIRKLTKGLATDSIMHSGLCVAIADMSKDMMETSKLKICCALKGFIESSVNDSFKLAMFRIVQEQLSNIAKHAKASKIAISIFQDKKRISMDITDNGIGFNTNLPSKGVGLENIRSRAVSFDGTANFVSSPGHGCVLHVMFPYSNALKNTEPVKKAG